MLLLLNNLNARIIDKSEINLCLLAVNHSQIMYDLYIFSHKMAVFKGLVIVDCGKDLRRGEYI